VSARLVPDPLARAAALAADRPALLGEGGPLSYAVLEAAASRAAATLRVFGVRPGERVALLARNGADAVVAVHAARRARAVLVPLHPRHTTAELVFTLRDSGARLLLHDEASAASARAASGEIDGLAVVALGTLADARARRGPVPAVRLADAQGIVYTSGTSALPKGVVLTHANHWWSAVGSALRLGTRDDDVWLLALPLAHIGGLAIVHRAALSAAPIVLLPSFDPTAANAAIDERGASLVSVVADSLRRMLDARGGRPFPPSLRRVLLGGGPAPRSLLDDCRRERIPVACTYGLTEAASQVATQADSAVPDASCGPPLAVTEVRIERDGASARPGAEGEILVRGPTVMAGYHARPEESARALDRGWLRTGDLGVLDERGELHVTGRRDLLIVSGGENVSPAEVERALLDHDAVAEALVRGAPHERWGTVPVAQVTLRPGATARAEDLAAHCRGLLASFKVPARIEIVPELPRGPSGKPLRRAAEADGSR